MTREKSVETSWPQRNWVLLVLGALVGFAIQRLGDLPDSGWEWGRRIVAALIVLLGVAAYAFALAWVRGRLVAAIIVALACGLIAGLVLLWNGAPGGDYEFGSWQMVCGLVAAGVLLMLFQAAQGRDAGLPTNWSLPAVIGWKREALVYADVHGAIWLDAILIGAAGLFTAISFAIAFMLGEMFHLVKIDLLQELLRKGWFDAMLAGGATGGAIGLLRDRAMIIGALQRVAQIVLRVLAPVLAVGLILFLAVLPFTGLAPLWATGNTTPLMLGGALMALFLANAVIGDGADDAATARPLRWGAMALGLALAPLVVIAAWSSGLRIAQHGLSPDRLWALTFIILGTVTAVAYAVAILGSGLRRTDWIATLQQTNLRLALLLGAVALLLSTPLIGFERISTADQIARLASGRVAAVDFDYKGLWFDFGPPGKSAIKRLATQAKDPQVRTFAIATRKLANRYDEAPNAVVRRNGDQLDARLAILPSKVPLEPALRARLTDYDACQHEGQCTLRYVPGQDYAVVIREPDAACKACRPDITLLHRDAKGDWGNVKDLALRITSDGEASRALGLARTQAAAARAGRFELRTVQRRQLFIDGKPFGDTIPMENDPQNAAEP